MTPGLPQAKPGIEQERPTIDGIWRNATLLKCSIVIMDAIMLTGKLIGAFEFVLSKMDKFIFDTHDFPMPANTKFCSICHCFVVIINNVKFYRYAIAFRLSKM